jgi:hypothetical protein
MQFDPENKIIKLCVDGMNAEARGACEEAMELFQSAWDHSTNDFERFTSAHYLARNQQAPEDRLKWNLEAMSYARAIENEDMRVHYPSLFLNIAKSYEALQDEANAKINYALAAEHSTFLPEGSYGDMIRSGIGAGLHRVQASELHHAVLDTLIDAWCARKALQPLAFLLPAYLGNLGTEADRNKLISALSYLSATRCLPPHEQAQIERIISELSCAPPTT